MNKSDIEAIASIRKTLEGFYPEITVAILEYCLIIATKDMEA